MIQLPLEIAACLAKSNFAQKALYAGILSEKISFISLKDTS